jgi:NitT/TauT family transport system substrate-binding protein
MPLRPTPSRRAIVTAGLATTLAGMLPAAARAAAPLAKPEKPALVLGLASFGSNFIPAYIANARTWKDAGLSVQLVGFRGDSEVVQASMTGLINMLNAGQPVAGFYAGYNQADFAWCAQPDIKTWADLKGKKIGVSTFGSVTDALTRYALRKHHLDPDRDVTIVQAGAAQSGYAALMAGTINAVILSPPYKWRAADAGYSTIATQEHEIAPRWPKVLYVAKTDFLKNNPATCEAFLRGHVAAIRLARRDPATAVQIEMDQLKFNQTDATRSVASALESMDETGNLPGPSMPTFWDVSIANGDVTQPWPESKFFDRQYVDSFARWAP